MTYPVNVIGLFGNTVPLRPSVQSHITKGDELEQIPDSKWSITVSRGIAESEMKLSAEISAPSFKMKSSLASATTASWGLSVKFRISVVKIAQDITSFLAGQTIPG
ncbi:hypothetical protein BDQ17DRAFT_1333846 [Cyathus striatus]|nr:hypothetical protein BDQ17DRAFT_1333846 [Cyathus striatus]